MITFEPKVYVMKDERLIGIIDQNDYGRFLYVPKGELYSSIKDTFSTLEECKKTII